MWTRVVHLLELIRFSHTLFAMPFALLSALMAWTLNVRSDPPIAWRWQELLGIVLAILCARSAAMAFNRLADREFDAANPRTRMRHIPRGLLSVPAVTMFALLAAAGFVASTLLFLPNRWPLYLSLPVLAFLLGYSYTKRFTSLAHFWLGAALMLAPIAAWIAVRGEVSWAAVILGLAVLTWVSGFDIIYACQDAEYDRSAGLHSVPARLGVAGALRVAALCHLGTVALLLALPAAYPYFGGLYWAGCVGVAALLAYEHWLVRPDDLTRVNDAFFHVNWVISLGLLVVGACDLLT
ncbi:MAG: UbiA family prenyltransferase [Planctomycetaceae bacterium]|nr:UbiA family prenyltransferase [Planctomycetaceae bacterium]